MGPSSRFESTERRMSRHKAAHIDLGEFFTGGLSTSSFRKLTKAIKEEIAEGRVESAARAIRTAVQPDLDLQSSLNLHRLIGRLGDAAPEPARRIRVAVVSSYTADPITQLIELNLFARDVRAEVYRADYGVLRQEILDPSSGLYSFKPDYLLLTPSWRDIVHLPKPGDGGERARELIRTEVADWLRLWEIAHERLGCEVIQDTFVQPAWRALGNRELQDPVSLGGTIRRLNIALADEAPSYVVLHDTEHLSASTGHWSWSDTRFFHVAKLPCAPASQVDYSHSIASLVTAKLGLSKKCLVLDLDNTLWGGVIGDDGLEGIRLGQGEAEGEAFVAFQEYVKRLKDRGVVLAVCSANDEKNAKEAFEKHPGMVLTLEDISCFVANWGSKADNIRTIAETLSLGLDSFVFFDDDAMQRSLVRRHVPEVEVPEVPSDPADYVRTLDKHRYFQVVSISAEDLVRTESYKANAKRIRLRESTETMDDFLASLEMRERTIPIGPMEVERSAQLINRSNQFNLTTRRRTLSELKAIIEDESWLTRCVFLTDRFGDNGLISVLLAHRDGAVLEIDTWVMSCRVLRRGVELHLWNCLVGEARRMGIERIVAEYLPTSKNGLVQDHYRKLGLDLVESDDTGRTKWECRVKDAPTPIASHHLQSVAS